MRAQRWMEYAERDLHGARVLLEAGDYNLACFHAAQAAEKYLKALILQVGEIPPRTHVLFRLNEILQASGINLGLSRQTMAKLSQHAILTRYPQQEDIRLDELYSAQDATEALGMAEGIRRACRNELGLNKENGPPCGPGV